MLAARCGQNLASGLSTWQQGKSFTGPHSPHYRSGFCSKLRRMLSSSAAERLQHEDR